MPETSTKSTSVRLDLARDLKATHAAAIVVGTIIGSGIFLVPSEMMQAVGSSGLVYLAWIVGGLLSFFGALTYAELGAMKPEAGGEYVYVRDGYGPLGGFLYGWTYFLIAKPASLATIVTGLVRILGTFGPLAFLPTVITTTPVTITYGHLAAITAIAAIAPEGTVHIQTDGIALLRHVELHFLARFGELFVRIRRHKLIRDHHDLAGAARANPDTAEHVIHFDASGLGVRDRERLTLGCFILYCAQCGRNEDTRSDQCA
jgi:hypothetical protein